MNAGCAVVVSDECGCAAELVDQDCGRVVPAGSETHLADALSSLLANPAQCTEMGLAAKRRVSQWGFDSDVEGLKIALDAVRRGIDQS